MNKYEEDPIQFDTRKKNGSIEILYSKLMEISQGGPEIGTLSLNNVEISGLFGGPAIIDKNYVYIPILVKKFIGNGFKVARINAFNFEIEMFGKIKNLIFLDRVENYRVYFFENMDKTVENYYEI